jgi:nicotinamide mononucleotide transporter
VLPHQEVFVTLSDGLTLIARSLTTVSPVEGCAALLGLFYVLLAVRESRWCWAFAFASTALYLVVFWQTRLFMQATLQGYFLAAAIYGWFAWNSSAAERAVTTGSIASSLRALVAVIVLAWVTGRILAVETHSSDPLLDAFTTWGSFYATWLQTRKRRENWLWWVAVDLVIMWLCLRQGLTLTAALYGLFVGLAVLGWRAWRPKPTP